MPNIKIACSKNETSPPPWDVRAAADIARVVDFLMAGLYTDDDALFSGFVTWTADIPHRPGCFGGHIVFRPRPFG